jgi:hypothetical protein
VQNLPLSSAVCQRQDRGDTSQAEGRGFESRFPLQINQIKAPTIAPNHLFT